MKTRRDFLRASAFVGAGLLLPWKKWNGERVLAAPTGARLNPRSLKKYLDPLPIPSAFSPTSNPSYPGADYYEIAMTQFTQKLHEKLQPTTLWGYGGTYPARTIEARTGTPVVVKWINNLPDTLFLPVDTTIMGAETNETRVVTHLHGGHVKPENDGGPYDWFTPGNHSVFEYPNSQRATTLWYHDHALGITRLNVYAGLAGFYLIRDDDEIKLNLPYGKFEIPLAIQDRSFYNDGSLFYPGAGQGAPAPVPPVWVPEFFGDVALVNGKVWPFLNVEPRKYRFRILNGCNARFLNLSFSNGLSMYQIGNEGGFLPGPVQLNEILLASAERADVIIDFSGYAGQSFILRNNAPSPFGGKVEVPKEDDEAPLPEIMEFRVGATLSERDTCTIPSSLPAIATIHESSAAKVRDLTLEEFVDANDNPIMLLLDGKHFNEPVTQKVQLGTNEIWRLINLTGDTHPIHLHLVQFQVLDRQPFDVGKYKATGHIVFTGPAALPAANELGRKDTVRANPGEITRIIAHFDIKGKFVWHCHILEHEENDMMRPFEVVTGQTAQTTHSEVELENYPNPFNPDTEIRFAIPNRGNVDVRVYNSVGQEIRTLANGLYETGEHTVRWDGVNAHGNVAPSGTYFIRLISKGLTRTIKMLMVK